MSKKSATVQSRTTALSKESIIDAAIALLDSKGESGLTFRALSQQLATGAGAIYWHIDNKSSLLTAACDSLIARTINQRLPNTTPTETIRNLALALFDTLDDHPWVGSALMQSPGQLPMVRILEHMGQQLVALKVPEAKHWATVSALLNYILGIAGQNAANRQLAQAHKTSRHDSLAKISAQWQQLDEADYPFTHSVAGQWCTHDDRIDFLYGIDLILAGLRAQGGS